ncbi:MAG TPA: PAS domain S-box protein [Burkholderiales bacterium]|nr:PAS domain S-box protein [Burkholderiales bacterium]
MARLRVLLLEDSPADAELALAALAAAGLDCAADIAQAHADFEQLYAADRYDVVLADYSLPDYTGLDALARVRAIDGLQPFILVSGALGEERAVEALRAGATDFVLKGNLNRLGPAVARALQENRQRREHLATQRALELSERRYRAIVEEQSELIIRMLPDLTVTFVNGAYCRYFGRTQAQVLGKSLLEHMRPEERGNAQRFLAAIGPSTPGYERDALVRDAGGAERWMHWATRGLFDADGALREIQSVGRDVTELKRAMDALGAARERLQWLSRRLLEVQEAERRHLARELHDDIGQGLTALKLNLEALARGRDGAALATRIAEALETARHTIERVRQLSVNLRPLQLDDLGLAAALRSHLDRQARLGGLAPHFEIQEVPLKLSPDVETACFRVAQEAINNIVRHARAANVWLRLFLAGERLALSVRDDGAGFDVTWAQRRAAAGESLGVVSMEERVALAGGTLQIHSAPGQGTVIVASFPVGAP